MILPAGKPKALALPARLPQDQQGDQDEQGSQVEHEDFSLPFSEGLGGEVNGDQDEGQPEQGISQDGQATALHGAAPMLVVQLAARHHGCQVLRGLAAFLIPPGALAVQIGPDFRCPDGAHSLYLVTVFLPVASGSFPVVPGAG